MSGKVEKSWSTGDYGMTISVKKYAGRKSLYLVWYDPNAPAGDKRMPDGTVITSYGNTRKESLGHADWEAAKREAKRIQRELETALEAQQTGTLTLTALFEKYEIAVILPRVEHKTRLGKKTDELAESRRHAELWKAYVRSVDPKAFGDVRRLTHDLIDRFVADRRAGRVRVPKRQLREEVTNTTIGADITFLNTASTTPRTRSGAGSPRTRSPVTVCCATRARSASGRPGIGTRRFARTPIASTSRGCSASGST